MWADILMGVVTVSTFLYIPGFLFLKGTGLCNVLAFCCAPVYGILMYALLPIIYYTLGIQCDLISLLAPTIVIAITVFLLSFWKHPSHGARILVAHEDPIGHDADNLSFDVAIPLVYVMIAAIVCGLTFTRHLPHTEAFYSRFDNQTHLNMVQSFLDSGKWSSFHANPYLASPVYAIPAQGNTGSFYPSAWHDLVALVCKSTGFYVPAATNCVLVAMCTVVWPLASYAFLRALFPQRRRLVELGAFVTSMFSTWPWVFVIKGPCYPNLLGLCLMTMLLAVIVAFREYGGSTRMRWVSLGAFCAMGLAALTLSHPNTLFSAVVFCTAYGSHAIITTLNASLSYSRLRLLMMKILAVGLLWVIVVTFWLYCYSNPLFNGVLGYHWTENTSIIKALISFFSLRLIVGGTQVVVCFIVLFGVIRCLRQRQFWLLFPPAFFALCFVACRCGWEGIKYWLAAIWYMTPYRFSALISIFCIPIAVIGFDSVIQFVTDRPLTSKIKSNNKALTRFCQPQTILVILFVLAVLPNIYIPFVHKKIETSFGRVSDSIHKIYATSPEKVYSAKEVEFVNEAMEAIPEGALVLNSPNDGSMWAYGVNQLNTYFRNRNASNQSDTAILIRTKLNEYAINEKVREAVKQTEAEYVLLLDKGIPYEEGVWIPQYKKGQVQSWKGIDAINDDTPGFEVVLSEDDDLRLYKMTAL